MMKKILSSFLFTLALFSVGSVRGEDEVFKDWHKNCNQNVCGVEQLILDSEGVPQVHVFVSKESKQFVMRVRVPLQVNLEAGLFILNNEHELSRTPYVHCLLNGCTSIILLDSDLIKTLRKKSEVHIGVFKKESSIKIPLSLKGISEALDSL